MSSIRYNEYLHILIQTCTGPEAISLVSVYLIERFLEGYTSSFELDMYKRQPVYKNSHIITIIVVAAVLCVLIYDLKIVAMDILLVYQHDVLGCSIITLQDLHTVFLDLLTLIFNALICVRDILRKETIPLSIRELVIVQFLELGSKVVYKSVRIMSTVSNITRAASSITL